jgi:starch synthase
VSAPQSDVARAASPIRVLQAAAEIFPLLKTGGLADVVAALPPALAEVGCDVRLLLPGIPALRDGVAGLVPVASLGAAFGAAQMRVLRGRMPDTGLTTYLLDAPWLFDRPGNPYLDASGREWPDNPARFAAFGWVAAHLAHGDIDPDWRADVLHAHDWHTGLAPAYLKMHPAQRVRSVYTIHNLAYQGGFRLADHRELGISASMIGIEGLEFHGQGNFMKSGLVYADRLTTVSPRYAREICTPEFGCGLDGVLLARRDRLTGILNGIDTEVWNPATDPLLPARFDSARLAGKALCKATVQQASGLDVTADRPMATMVSRLTDQKGCDLVLAAAPDLIQRGLQLTVLGTGAASLERGFHELAARFPAQVSVQTRYDEALAHGLIAAADFILVPSRFEPCGLTQMYGHRYGTLPVVREVGGLADTVVDATPAAIAESRATGFVFREASDAALRAALVRAMDCWQVAAVRDGIRRTAMAVDHGWSTSARAMRAVYEDALGRVRPPS